jgi:hypothetical protein
MLDFRKHTVPRDNGFDKSRGCWHHGARIGNLAVIKAPVVPIPAAAAELVGADYSDGGVGFGKSYHARQAFGKQPIVG